MSDDLIIQHRRLLPSPVIFILRHNIVECSKGVSSQQQSSSFSASQTKVLFEEVSSHDSIAKGAGMMFLFGSLPALQTCFRGTIRPSSEELKRFLSFNLTIWFIGS